MQHIQHSSPLSRQHSPYSADPMSGQQMHPPQVPSSLLLQSDESLGHMQGRRPTHASGVHSATGDQSPLFVPGQSTPSMNMCAIHRPTGYPINRAVAVHSRPPGSNSTMVSPTEPRPDPMRVFNILTSGEGNDSGMGINNYLGDGCYELSIRQQPIAARSCGFAEKDRRVIDPPPIVQLLIQSPSLPEEAIAKHLRYPHYVMSCCIYDGSGSHDASFMPEEYRQRRRLMGLLVSTPFVGKDENGDEGCFFCFPDLSCRTPGSFRLGFSLTKIDPMRASEVKRFPFLAEAQSNTFKVYTAKDFPGMQPSTSLTKRLKEQGCLISIRKANGGSKNTREHDDSSDGEVAT